MIVVSRMAKSNEWDETTVRSMIGQTAPFRAGGVQSGTTTVTNAWIEDGWVVCKLELDAAATALVHAVGISP